MSRLDFVVRESKKEDMESVMKLIIELAEFEKLENQVKINANVLIKDAFDSDHPAFKCLVAETSDKDIIGYALYYIAYSTWLGRYIFLEDLYVQPTYRHQGVGNKLFMAVAKIAHQTESKRMNFQVLSWNPAKEFYTKIGAENYTALEGWNMFRLDENALNKLFEQ